MKKFALLSLTLGVIMAIGVGCKKYEEGPLISFKSKESRVINTWKAKYVFRDDEDVTAWFDQWEWMTDLKEDGRMEVSTKIDEDSVFVQHGFWDLENDKVEIRFIYTDPPVTPDRKNVEILKLLDDELWFRDVTDTAVWVYRLIPN